ncbi:ImmA/IrrE family metallo-endopeptidase [Macrococcus armenti]|uniref:ImmA/IrrE family metallo-endopeptidase n=1 Tax=Macrococcus armenti TaxID=2875764 RepID=UPI001CCB8D70|nr:ImmA/IrrE family metallo-endopeptidase [Macrococcus armenti]UBH07883.1 ImmA/IrrE family metallo-endopeptidase [Macrococcus armenti]
MQIEYQHSFLKAAKEVRKVSEELRIDQYPLDIIKLIEEDEDVQLMTFQKFSKITGTLFYKIPSTFGSSEAFHIRKGDKAFIIYNDMLPINRLRFTLAHEYGHFKMKHTGVNLNEDITYKDYYRIKSEEYEANTFASCLLFPLHIRYKYKDYLSLSEISDLFQISVQAAKIAMDILEEHLRNGLEQIISIYENNHLDNYISYLEEMLWEKKEYARSLSNVYQYDYSF